MKGGLTMSYGRSGPPAADLEPGALAKAGLAHIRSRALNAIRARATFQPVREDELVAIWPCPICGDGGQRAVGRVRGRGHWQQVHACDTCGMLQLDAPSDPHL